MPQIPDLIDRTALVTGASSGIGAATAVALAGCGAHIVLHWSANREGAEQTLAAIHAVGGHGELVRADLSHAAGINGLVDLIGSRPIDILVNNAGSLLRRTQLLDITPDLWERTFALNLTSAVRLTQTVLPGMLERGHGIIINMSSIAARNGGGPGAIAYASAKAALSTFTRGLAKEFASQGIRANTIAPGTIETNYHRQFSTIAAMEASRAGTPQGRNGTPQDVAEVAVFLCSDSARYIQGQSIEVNGGTLMP